MKNKKKLIDHKRNGIKLLQSYIDDDQGKKDLKTKIDNISGKTGRYFVSNFLFQQRTNRYNRVLIPYKHVVTNKFSIEDLECFEGGVAVEFTNMDFFDEIKKTGENQSEIFKQLSSKLGSDERVSSIIVIRSDGQSSSDTQRKAHSELVAYLKNENLELNEHLIKRKPKGSTKRNYSGEGNDVWEGFVYFLINGGEKDTIHSHTGIKQNNVNLFNPSVEYASRRISEHITLVLLYFAIHSIECDKRENNWYEYRDSLKDVLYSIEYDEGNLYEYVDKHISLNIVRDILHDPITMEPIILDDFTISSRESNSLDISHQSAVNKSTYIKDEKQNVILTAARPTNLFWAKHISNMMQQDFSLEEYYKFQQNCNNKWHKNIIVSKLLKGK